MPSWTRPEKPPIVLKASLAFSGGAIGVGR
jgi:hypothetical protein